MGIFVKQLVFFLSKSSTIGTIYSLRHLMKRIYKEEILQNDFYSHKKPYDMVPRDLSWWIFLRKRAKEYPLVILV